MNKILDPDNRFWRVFGRIADYFILTMTWLACCLPVITAGTATIALFDAACRCIRGGEDNMIRRFFRTFRKDLLRGILLTVLWAVPAAALSIGWQIIGQLAVSSVIWKAFGIVYLITLFVPLGVWCWVIAIEARFVNRVGELHRNALALTFGYLPQTAAVVGILVAALVVLRYLPYLLLFLPAAVAHLQSGFVEKVFEWCISSDEPEQTECIEGTEEIE